MFAGFTFSGRNNLFKLYPSYLARGEKMKIIDEVLEIESTLVTRGILGAEDEETPKK